MQVTLTEKELTIIVSMYAKEILQVSSPEITWNIRYKPARAECTVSDAPTTQEPASKAALVPEAPAVPAHPPINVEDILDCL